MKCSILISTLCTLSVASAIAQTEPGTPTSPTSAAPSQRDGAHARTTSAPGTKEKRPDAAYPERSGQHSEPNKPIHSKAPSTASKTPSPASSRQAARGNRGPHAEAKAGVYTGATGKKPDPGTACSTARVTPAGALDCGTGGDGATAGKIVTK